MKTAVSIPDDVFAGAERLALRTKRSRSRLYSDAPEESTGAQEDKFSSCAAALILKQSEW